MKRRDFMRLAAASTLIAAAPAARATAADGWRTFELRYEVDLSAHAGAGRLWLPLPQDAPGFQRVVSIDRVSAPADAAIRRDTDYGAAIFSAAWDRDARERAVVVRALVATRDRERGETKPSAADAEAARRYLAPTTHMPNDGVVAATANRIVAGIQDPDLRARAIYDWVVDHSFRNPKTRGCGLGDIKFMLETGDLGGKCADINSLFVGLARAAGLPARELYGVRVAESRLFKSLGKGGGDVSKAHHCRAEYFSPRFGWVGVDPADVRKAVLEESLPLADARIVALRERLFGHWEMNWVGFNSARDFTLAPAASGPVPYLMYPYAEFGDAVLDGREPEKFAYRIVSRAS